MRPVQTQISCEVLRFRVGIEESYSTIALERECEVCRVVTFRRTKVSDPKRSIPPCCPADPHPRLPPTLCTVVVVCFLLLRQGLWAIGAVMLYCGSGFLGGSCAVALTKRFGALHSAITTTARKAVTLMLSFAYFQKAFTPQHLVGASVFMVGLMVSSRIIWTSSVACLIRDP